MANRQRIPSWGLSGAMAKRPVAAQITHPAQRFIASETGAYTDSVLLNTANMLADKMHKTETERLAMQADVSLKATRQALENAQSPDQLRDMVKNNDKVLAAQFDGDKKTQDFWRNHGDKILAANQADTQKIIAQKQIDFGKQSLNSMLADNQNLLAETQDELKAEKLLQMGSDEIQNTPFLNDNDKDTYRQGYLKTGILNLALHNPDAADKAVDAYFDDDTLKSTLKAQIQQTKAINDDYLRQDEERQKRISYLNQFALAQDLWQKKERGDISPAQYYVLSQNSHAPTHRGDFNVSVWGDDEQRSDTPLTETYRLVRKMNEGTPLSVQEISDASNYLINAYRQNKLGFEETAALQNQLLAAQTDKNTAELMFDREIDGLADKAFGADMSSSLTRGDYAAKLLMEDKARFALNLYQNYYAQKTALTSALLQNGGQLTPLAEKQISREALNNVTQDLKLKLNGEREAASFGQLKQALQSAYSGSNVLPIWRQYAKVAPYSDDKMETMRQIAREMQKKELTYPKFETTEELMQADLAPGDKFYFKGRLAVMKG